jgi:hypothetical protein
MKKWLLPAAAVAATLAFVGLRLDPQPVPVARGFATLPPHFEPSGDNAYAARAAGVALELDDSGSRMRLARGTRATTVSLQLEGSSPSSARPENRLPGVSNYFLGNDPGAWRVGVPHYARVRYAGVYPGVDLVYYGAQGTLEYDFLVAPGADPHHIRMRYDGAQSLRLDANGNLRIAVDGGELVHRRPVSWQQVDGIRQRVQSAFRLLREAGTTLVTFELGAYDARLPLTIDPVLSYATYLGGTDDNDDAMAIAVDAAGATFVAGHTNSVDFPATAGAAQPARSGSFDAYVAKLNPAGTAYEYLTYLGGTGLEQLQALRIDAGGNAYVAGETSSVDFPTSASAPQATSGGSQDVFVSKLNATGGVLLYSTYLGGSGGEPGSQNISLEVDAGGNAFVLSDTDSVDFPTTPGAPQTTRGNPNAMVFDQDVFLTRINANGTAFDFSTYLGGSGIEENDVTAEDVRLLAVDGNGSAWIAGTTESADFPATTGSLQTTFGGPAGGIPGGGDAFVARYDTDAGTLTYATFVGGSADDFARALAVDAAGNAYLAVATESGNFPTSAGAPDTTFNGGNSDVALAKISPDGTTLAYGTYLGAGLLDAPIALRLDSTGRAYVAGETDSSTFPVSAGAADTTLNGGADGFIARLNAAGTAFDYVTFAGSGDDEAVYMLEIDAAGSAYALLGDTVGDGFLTAGARAHAGGWDDYFVKVSPSGDSFLDASYLGGAEDDYATGIAVDADENLYLTGITASSNYPVTAGAPQAAKAGDPGDPDTFIAKLATTPAGPVVQPGTLSLSATTFSASETGGSASITVTRSGGSSGAVGVTCTAAAAGGDTAGPGTDFTAAAVTLSWADGDAANKTCAIPVTNDTDVESAETFTVTLANATGGAALGATTSAAVTIDDDDVAPLPVPGTVQFDPASVSAGENSGSVTLTLTRTVGADGAISVSVTTGGGSASAGSDYTALAATVSWADGDSASKTVALALLDDSTDESNETVSVVLGDATGNVTLGGNGAVTILDDDVPPPPVTQTTSAKGRYGGALDGVMVLVLLGVAAVSMLARHCLRGRHRTAMLAAVALGSATLGAAPGAQAGDFYLGGRAGLGQSTQDSADIASALRAEGHDARVTMDDDEAIYTLFGGFRWSNGLAVEASVFDLGMFEVEVEAETSSAADLLSDTEALLGDSGRGVGTALAWTWRLGEHFEITPRVGAYYWESRRTLESNADRIEDREFGVDLMGGISFDYRLDSHWRLGLGWESWAAGGRNDVQAVTASLSYQFSK